MNPYENMPLVGDFQLFNEGDLVADLNQIMILRDVSKYLIDKVYKSWEDRSIRKQNKGPSKIEISNEFSKARQNKYLKNLEQFKQTEAKF